MGFGPLALRVPPAEEVERFSGLDLLGLQMLRASKTPLKAL